MSQYPSPYSVPSQQPPGYYSTGGDLLAPARRASILMFVIGGLAVLCSFCLGLAVRFVPLSDAVARSGISATDTSVFGMTPEEFLRRMFIIMAIASIVAGITMIVLASFVRRGGLVSIVFSIALSALALLFLLVNIISGVVKALQGSAEDLAGVLILLVITGLVMLLLFLLIQAARAVPRIRNAQAQYQMQYWQYLQQQQAYAQQAGYGYGYPQQQAQQPSSQQPQAQPGPQQPPVDPPSPPANP